MARGGGIHLSAAKLREGKDPSRDKMLVLGCDVNVSNS